MKALNNKWLIALISSGLLLIAFILNHQFPRPTPNQQAITLGATTDYYVSQDTPQLPIQNDQYTFNLLIPQGQQQAQLTFFYRCTPSCSRMWLEYPDLENNLVQILIDHPIFHTQKWPHITNHIVSLYQKDTSYTTLADFVTDPPTSPIATEPFLSQHILAPHLTTHSLMDTDQPSGDYIFTSYIKPRVFAPDWLEFSRSLTLDPSTASIAATLHFPEWQTHSTTITQPQLQFSPTN